MLTKRTVILVKKETTYGQDSFPTKEANAILAIDAKVTPVFQSINRETEIGEQSKPNPSPGQRYFDLSFSIELQGSGNPITPPRFGGLLKIMGLLETIGTDNIAYTPAEENVDSASVYVYLDGSLYKILGTVGVSLKIVITAGGDKNLNCTLRGLYQEPTDVAVPSGAVYDTPAPQIVQSSQFTFNAKTVYVIKEVSISIDNSVAIRGDVSSATEVKGFAITGRKITAQINPEAILGATENLWSFLTGLLPKTFSIITGSGTGNKWTITAPKVSIDKIDLIDDEGVQKFNIPLSMGINSGDDELSLTMST